MLTITKEQMIRADAKTRVHFHRRVREDLCEKMPEKIAAYPDSTLLAYIGEQDKIAGEHGIHSEKGIVNWVVLSLSDEPNFYQKAEAKDYFAAPGPPNAETRLSVLVDYILVRKHNPDVTMDTIVAEQGYSRMGG
jgi:hypothetical protein